MTPSLCWHCNGEYPIDADRCPHCKATNPNVDLGRANAELADPSLIGKDLWTVVEWCGYEGETQVFACDNYGDANTAYGELYTDDAERDELHVTILRNGSTEW